MPESKSQNSLTIISEIKAGTLHPKDIDLESRQNCVELLCLKGLSMQDIADLFQCSEKTIQRDKAAIRRRNEIHPNPEFISQQVGQLLIHAEHSTNQLRKFSQDRTASVADRSNAEYLSWLVQDQACKRLQSIGYLPKVANQHIHQVMHHQRPDIEDTLLGEIMEITAQIEASEEEGIHLTEEQKKKLDEYKYTMKQIHETSKIKKQLKTLVDPQQDNG